jgi:hypothetical protein
MQAIKGGQLNGAVMNEEKAAPPSLRDNAKKIMEPFIMQLEQFDLSEVSDEKMQVIIDFATKLFAKNYNLPPRHKMKEHRMLRKIQEHFHLQLKPDTNESN